MKTISKSINKPVALPSPAGNVVLDYLATIKDESFSELLTPSARFAADLPACSGNIFEMHFNRPENSFDFATRLNKQYDQALLAGPAVKTFGLPLPLQLLFDQGVENIWIEYDAPFIELPALFFDIDRNKKFCPETAINKLDKICSLYQTPSKRTLLPLLKKIDELGAYVVYYGLMFSRQLAPMRLTLNGINPENLTAFMENIGWRGNRELLQQIYTRFLHPDQKIVVGVDWNHELGTRIGIEIFDKDNAGFMQKLHEHGYVNTQQLNWLSQWEQVSVMPLKLSRSLSRLHCREIKESHCRINHFKIIVDQKQDITAKAYLYHCF